MKMRSSTISATSTVTNSDSICSGGVHVVDGGDDLNARGGDDLLIDEDDGAGRAAGVGDLGAVVHGYGGAVGDGSGRHHDDRVGSCGDVEVAGVEAEGEVGDERGDGGDLLSSGDEVDVDSTGAGGLIEEAQ